MDIKDNENLNEAGGILVGAATVAGAAALSSAVTLAGKIYRDYISKAGKVCRDKSGYERKICEAKFRLAAAIKAKTTLLQNKSAITKTKNPEKAKAKFEKLMKMWDVKIKDAKEKLATAQINVK